MSANQERSMLLKFIILSLSLVLKSNITAGDIKFKGRTDAKFKAEYVSEEIISVSLAQCLAYCAQQQGCISGSFKSSSENCLLSTYNTVDEIGSSPGTPHSIEYAAGWRTMSMVRYPVFQVTSNYERYSMTFDQAKQVCIDYGTSIATPSDLLEARAIGYQYCACGWLSDNTNGFVLQAPNSACSSMFHEGIVLCNRNKANVYCKQ